MDLLDNSDKYGLTEIKGNKIFIFTEKPLQLVIDERTYLINFPDYICDINIDLYKYLIKEIKNNNKLMLRLYKQMLQEKPIMFFEKYYGKNIDLKNIKKEINNFKNITYNPENNDKFVACIDIEKCFMHIYEFIANSETYKAKYIHAKFDRNSNFITHLDYSINQYSKEQYESIIVNPKAIEKCDIHKKIWRLDGNISVESFYNIIFCMFEKNEKYIKELFKVEI